MRNIFKLKVGNRGFGSDGPDGIERTPTVGPSPTQLAREVVEGQHYRQSRLPERDGAAPQRSPELPSFRLSPSGLTTPAYTGIYAERRPRSEAHTSELQSLMRIPYAAFCLKK